MNKKIIEEFIESEFLRRTPVKDYDADFSLIESGVIDSLGIQLLIAFIENRFGIQVDDMDLLPENFDSINALTAYVESKQS